MDFGLTPLDDTHRCLLSFMPSNIYNLIEYHRGLSDFDTSHPEDYMLYTGRGPSQGSFHIGHLPGILVIKSFQEYLKSKIFFMISDDEKIFRDDIDSGKMASNVKATLSQLSLLGLSEDNTLYHVNSKGISEEHYSILIRLMSMTSIHVLNNIFGEKGNVGEYFYPLYQILPCFLGKQCIIVAGKDQDPFFRLARDLARRMGHKPPIILYTKSVPGLDGSDKMSTSVPTSLPIFLTDTQAEVKAKIAKVKKVGAGSLDELFERGADLKRDTLYDLIQFFETDEGHLDILTTGYTRGFTEPASVELAKTLCGEKGVYARDNKTMITTGGVRSYLSKLISAFLSAVQQKSVTH